MIAPAGGFSPTGSSGGIGVSLLLFERTRIAVAGVGFSFKLESAAIGQL